MVAKPGLDGHDRGAKVVARALRDAGNEVIYTGLHQTPEQIVETALAEDADAIGVSVLSGAHMTLFRTLIGLLDQRDARDIVVFGGGIIPQDDIPELRAARGRDDLHPGRHHHRDRPLGRRARGRRERGRPADAPLGYGGHPGAVACRATNVRTSPATGPACVRGTQWPASRSARSSRGAGVGDVAQRRRGDEVVVPRHHQQHRQPGDAVAGVAQPAPHVGAVEAEPARAVLAEARAPSGRPGRRPAPAARRALSAVAAAR